MNSKVILLTIVLAVCLALVPYELLFKLFQANDCPNMDQATLEIVNLNPSLSIMFYYQYKSCKNCEMLLLKEIGPAETHTLEDLNSKYDYDFMVSTKVPDGKRENLCGDAMHVELGECGHYQLGTL